MGQSSALCIQQRGIRILGSPYATLWIDCGSEGGESLSLIIRRGPSSPHVVGVDKHAPSCKLDTSATLVLSGSGKHECIVLFLVGRCSSAIALCLCSNRAATRGNIVKGQENSARPFRPFAGILQALGTPRNTSRLPYKEEVAGSNPASSTLGRWSQRA